MRWADIKVTHSEFLAGYQCPVYREGWSALLKPAKRHQSCPHIDKSQNMFSVMRGKYKLSPTDLNQKGSLAVAEITAM